MRTRGSPWLLGGEAGPAATTTLFCIPHGGGGAHAYRDVLRLAPTQLDVCAIQLPGRGPRLAEPDCASIDEAADAIAEAIAAGADRPYALFGHSVGALIAFEVARRLEAAAGERPMRLFVSAYVPCARTAGDPIASDRKAEAPPLHDLDDADFLAALETFGAIDAAALADPELRRLVIRPTRADFRMAHAHTISKGARLLTPVTVFAGREDAAAPPEAMAAWEGFAASLDSDAFEGGHFYFQPDPTPLLAAVSQRLSADLAARPRSLVSGRPCSIRDTANLAADFDKVASQQPESLAVVDTSEHYTFGELKRRADRIALALRRKGVAPRDIVGLHLDHGLPLIAAMLGAMKAGAAFLHLPLSQPGELIERTLEDLDIRAVILPDVPPGRPAQAGFEAGHAARPALQVFRLTATGELRGTLLTPTRGETAQRFPRVSADDPAFAVLTSGTTGRPKAIVCRHRSALAAAQWRHSHLPYRRDDREACGIFFIWEALRPLLAGRPVYILDDATLQDTRRLAEALARDRITRVLLTPSAFAQLLQLPDGLLSPVREGLKTVILNGEVVPRQLAERACKLLPDCRLINDYSISETHDVATTPMRGSQASRGADAYGPVLPSGEVMDGVRVAILDPDGNPTPFGVPGHIHVSGDGLALGYLNAPGEMAARFVPDPFAPRTQKADQSETMFRTGDVGRFLPDGRLCVHGRSHFMFKLRGYSIVPGAIESILRQHPAIEDAAVEAVLDPRTRQPEKIAAFLVPAHDAAGTDGPDIAGAGTTERSDLNAQVRTYLRRHLPPEAVPSILQWRATLPTDPVTGKRDGRRLLASLDQRLTGPPAGMETLDMEEAGAVPPDPLAVELSAAWSTVLGRPPKDAQAHFFDEGGHSLSASALALKLSEAIDSRIDAADIYAEPVFAGLLAELRKRAPERTAGQPGTHQPRTTATSTSRAVSNHPVTTRSASARDRDRDIAVIGLACRFPGVDSPEALWQASLAGTSTLGRLSPEELDRLAVPASLRSREDFLAINTSLASVELFDPSFWGLSQREAVLMDPQHRLFVECCCRLMEHAGHGPGDADGEIGIFAGCYLPTYLVHHLDAARQLSPDNPTAFHHAEIGNDKDYLATRTAYLLDIHGPAITVQSSCSTGLVAIAQAADALRAGSCRMAIAGASSLIFPQGGFTAPEGFVASRSGCVKTFDRDADGTILADGVAAVLLRPLSHALEDGDTIHAVIRGYAINNDGHRKAGFSAPSEKGQRSALRRALDDAGLSPDAVGYIETHGTGTPIGDALEVRAIKSVYGQTAPTPFSRDAGTSSPDAAPCAAPCAPPPCAPPPCALGSVKPVVGHSNIAAGVAGFIRACLAVHHGQVPPLATLHTPHPDLHLEGTRFILPREALDWPAADHGPSGEPASMGPQDEDITARQPSRYAAVSSFGIGGTNAHMILQAPPPEALQEPEAAVPPAPIAVLPLSAKTTSALARHARELAEALALMTKPRARPARLSDIAFTLQEGRRAYKKRAWIAAANLSDAVARLQDIGDALTVDDRSATADSRLPDAIASQLEAWRDGGQLDWQALRTSLGDTAPSRARRRITLPGHPFDPIRCWPGPAPVQEARANPVPAEPAGSPPRPDDEAGQLRDQALTTDRPPAKGPALYRPVLVPLPRRAPSEPPSSRLRTRSWLMVSPPDNPAADGASDGFADDPPRYLSNLLAGAANQPEDPDAAPAWHATPIHAGPPEELAERIASRLQDTNSGPVPGAASHPAAPEVSILIYNPAACATPSQDSMSEVHAMSAHARSSITASTDPNDEQERLERSLAWLTGLLNALSARRLPSLNLWLVLPAHNQGDRAAAAAIEAAARVANQELSDIAIRSIRLPPASEAVAGLSGLLANPTQFEDHATVIMDGDQLLVPSFEAHEPDTETDEAPAGQGAATAPSKQSTAGKVDLIIGGLGRIGTALALRLIGQGRHAIITTRRPIGDIPARIADAAIASGGRLQVRQLDPTDATALLRCLGNIRASGRQVGNVHLCAGLADLKYLPDIDAETFRAEFSAKAGVSLALDTALTKAARSFGVTCDAVAVYSSLAAPLGGYGMAAYAAANAYLDARVEHLDQREGIPRPRWLSINWDDWAFDYGKEQTPAYVRTRAHLAIPPSTGLELLDRILSSPNLTRIAVAGGDDLVERHARWTRPRRKSHPAGFSGTTGTAAATTPNNADNDNTGATPRQKKSSPPALSNTTSSRGVDGPPVPAPSEAGVVDRILSAYRRTLGDAALHPGADFFGLGGDSLLAVDVVAAFGSDLPPELTPRISDIMEYPTPERLARELLARRKDLGHARNQQA